MLGDWNSLLLFALFFIVGMALWSRLRRLRRRVLHTSLEIDPGNLFDESPLAYCEADSKGRARRVNQRWSALFGLDGADISGYLVTDFLPEAEREKFQEDFVRKIRGETELVPHQRKFRRADGGALTLEVHEALIRNRAGAVCGLRLAALDVTEHQRVEEVAFQSSAELKAVFETLPDLFLRLDAKGRVLEARVNAGSDLNGLARKLSGKRIQDCVPPEAARQIEEALSETQRKGKMTMVECPVPDPIADRAYEVRFLPLYWNTVIAVIRDITDRRQAQERLAAYARELELKNEQLQAALEGARAATELKSNFLATMSHEIRTPMNGILGMMEFLLGTSLDKEQQECADSVKASADSLLTLINDILDISRIEAGKLRLDRIPFDPAALLREIVQTFSIRAQAKGLAFRWRLPPQIPPAVSGDPGRLRQILNNLLGNALKFTDHGSVTLAAEVAGPSAGLVTLRFTVTDTGIGIQPDQRAFLFQSFSQGDASRTRKYGGSGLGLAISKQLAEMLGGEIGYDSEPGRGSTFWFTAVFERAAPQAVSGEWHRAELDGLRVLLLQDSSADAALLRRCLQDWNCRVTEIRHPARLVQCLREAVDAGSPIRIALVEAGLPGLDGAAIAAALRKYTGLACTSVVPIVPPGFPLRNLPLAGAGFTAPLQRPLTQATIEAALIDALKAPGVTPELPVVSEARSPIREPLADARGSVPSHDRKGVVAPELRPASAAKILLAEDNLVNQKVALRLLEKAGHLADVVANGREAVDAVRRRRYDLVLLDVQMPVMDGLEAAGEIRRLEGSARRTALCALTANAMTGDRERCLQAGMDDYISKPVTLAELQRAIDRWIPKSAGAQGPPAAEVAPASLAAK